MPEASLHRAQSCRAARRTRRLAPLLAVVPSTLVLWWGLGANSVLEPTSLVSLILLLLALTSVLALVWPGRADQAEKD